MADQVQQDRTRAFQEFLNEDYGNNVYKQQIAKMIDSKRNRLIVDLNQLAAYNPQMCRGILESPMDYIPCFDEALSDTVKQLTDSDLLYRVGFSGSFGHHQVPVGQLGSQHLGQMLQVEGIVVRCSLVRPKIARSVHYCEKTQLFHAKEYRDGYSLGNEIPTGSMYPKTDDQGNPLTTEFGYSTFRDYQMVYIQEMPERSPAGQLPRPVDILLDDDLVDSIKPGDRVQISGVYRSLGKGAGSAIFRTVFIANNVAMLNKEVNAPTLTEVDTREIRKISKRKDCFSLVSQSLAPSLFGHDYIKKSLLLLMLGGMEKNLENGTHLRGDINILLIGDPSVGKSQMLRFVLNLAPLAIATTGRGSSGVGLTAAVTQDKETGERTLEAGAMVLADRGVVCIDEFDKMSDIDRVAIHEVMEQQTVTIAKAGIHTSLNARCSVLAAANPQFGSYLDEKKPFENITLPDSLLSRFDLVFVVLDKTDDEFNRAISDHITRLHRYFPPGLEEGTPMTEAVMNSLKETAIEKDDESGVFQKYNELLHIGYRPASRRRKANEVEILSIPFLKKYIYYAKNRIKPILSAEACDYISNRYAELRNKADGQDDQYRTMPITPRTLETLIRLSTAHAKLRLSRVVDIVDTEVAFEILVYALFKELKPKKRAGKKVKTADSSSDEDEGESIRESVVSQPSTARLSAVTGASSRIESLVGHMNIDDDTSTVAASSNVRELAEPGQALAGSETYLFQIRERIQLSQPDNPTLTIDLLVENIAAMGGRFGRQQIIQTVEHMSEQNTGIWYQSDIQSIVFI